MREDTELLGHVRLHFHVQHPAYDEVWLEGFEEGRLELTEDDNPYPNHTIEYQYWSDGWWAAFYDEPALFDLEGKIIPHTIPEQIQPLRIQRRKSFDYIRFAQLVIAFLCGSAVVAVCYDLS